MNNKYIFSFLFLVILTAVSLLLFNSQTSDSTTVPDTTTTTTVPDTTTTTTVPDTTTTTTVPDKYLRRRRICSDSRRRGGW